MLERAVRTSTRRRKKEARKVKKEADAINAKRMSLRSCSEVARWTEIQYQNKAGKITVIRIDNPKDVQMMMDGLVPVGSKYRIVNVVRMGPLEPEWKILK